LYEKGTGVTKSTAKAAELYKSAADQGNPYAQYNLARYYEEGIVVTKDSAKAFDLYQKAANQGNTFAQDKLKQLKAQSKKR